MSTFLFFLTLLSVLLTLGFCQVTDEEVPFEDPHVTVDEDGVEVGLGAAVGQFGDNGVVVVDEWIPDIEQVDGEDRLTFDSCLSRNYQTGHMTIRFIPVEFLGAASYKKMPENYLTLIRQYADVLGRSIARSTGKPYTVTPLIEPVQYLNESTYTKGSTNLIMSTYQTWASATFGCTRANFCSPTATVHGCMVLPSHTWTNAAVLGNFFGAAHIKKPRTVLHEIMHAQFYSAHDRCYDMTSGYAVEYGNRYSSLGRPYDSATTADQMPTPGLATAVQHNLFRSVEQLADISQDGTTVTLSAFDVYRTRSDPSALLAARVSLDVENPHLYVLVSFRALIDIFTGYDGSSLHDTPPAGGVVVTGHHRLRTTGYSNGASVVDATPGSLQMGRSGGTTDCEDGALTAGQQLYLAPLDLMIEVEKITRIGLYPATRQSDNDKWYERHAAIDEIDDVATAVVSFYRISGLPARRAALCGNGVRDPSEQCDGGAGCTAECQCDAGYEIAFGNQRQAHCVPVCGNGRLDYLEECDASTGANGAQFCDASTCRCAGEYKPARLGFEMGTPKFDTRTCYDGTTPHVDTTCGNGVRDDREVCDGTPGCTSMCQCAARPDLLVAGVDTDLQPYERSGSLYPALFQVSGQCAGWFDHPSVPQWATSFRGKKGAPSGLRLADGSAGASAGDGEGGLSLGIILALAAGGVVCCCFALCTAMVIVAFVRRQSNSTVAAKRHVASNRSRSPSHRRTRSNSQASVRPHDSPTNRRGTGNLSSMTR